MIAMIINDIIMINTMMMTCTHNFVPQPHGDVGMLLPMASGQKYLFDMLSISNLSILYFQKYELFI